MSIRSCGQGRIILAAAVPLLRMTLSRGGMFCEVYRFLSPMIVRITPLRQYMAKRPPIDAIEMVKPWEQAVPQSLIFNLIWSGAGTQQNPEGLVVHHRPANSTSISRMFFRSCG